jgi:hypothetical protein
MEIMSKRIYPYVSIRPGSGTRAIGGYLPNCTPDGYDVGASGESPYPVFLDPNVDRTPDPRTFWGLSKAVRYILANWNTSTLGSLVDNPDFGALDALLQNRRPVQGAEFFDPDNSQTYQTDHNRIRSFLTVIRRNCRHMFGAIAPDETRSFRWYAAWSL